MNELSSLPGRVAHPRRGRRRPARARRDSRPIGTTLLIRGGIQHRNGESCSTSRLFGVCAAPSVGRDVHPGMASTSERHQLSYTIPFSGRCRSAGSTPGSATSRSNIVSGSARRRIPGGRVAALERSGSHGREEWGHGSGSAGIELKCRAIELSPWVVSHSNLGGRWIPSARSESGEKAAARGFFVGKELIWLVHPKFNLMPSRSGLEMRPSSETMTPTGSTARHLAGGLGGIRLARGFRSSTASRCDRSWSEYGERGVLST